jgi:hypothetical protein
MGYKFNPFTGNFDAVDSPDGVFESVEGRLSFPLGTAALPSIHPGTDTNTGIYSPDADQVAISTNGVGRLFVDSTGGIVSAAINNWNFSQLFIKRSTSNVAEAKFLSFGLDGDTIDNTARTAYGNIWGTFDSTPTTSSTFSGLNGILNFGGPNALAFHTNGFERLRITSDGKLGLGTSSPDALLTVNGVGAFGAGTAALPSIARSSDLDTGAWFPEANTIAASTAGVERLRIDSTGRVGIGTTSPATTLDVNGDVTIADKIIHGGDTNTAIRFPAADTVSVETGGSERARIDSSGRLLVGTSTSITTLIEPGLQVQSTGANAYTSIGRWDNNAANSGLIFNKSRGGSVGTFGIVQSGDSLGEITFVGDDGSAFVAAARIQAQVDGTPGVTDMPGRLVFSTTADGANNSTERMRITSAGVLQIADAGNITVGTTTGTKIGTATTQKIGFYNATPVVQPTAVADATTAIDVITQLNDLLAKLRTLGIIAT